MIKFLCFFLLAMVAMHFLLPAHSLSGGLTIGIRTVVAVGAAGLVCWLLGK